MLFAARRHPGARSASSRALRHRRRLLSRCVRRVRQASCRFATPACTISAPTHIATSAVTRAGRSFHVALLLLERSSLELRRQLVGLLFELVASRGDVVPLLLPGAVDGVARLHEALVDRDPARADLADRRLGLLARLPRLRRGARLQPLEVRVPAAELVLDGGRERRPVVGDVCGQRMLGDGEPRPQLPELLLDLVGSLADRGADGCLLLVQCVEVTPDSRSLRVAPACASACSRSIRRWTSASSSSIVVVLMSSLLFVCSLTARRLVGADANALPGAAAVLPAR